MVGLKSKEEEEEEEEKEKEKYMNKQSIVENKA
jgi:hypothetical protein